jgi:hypothetical protein
MIRNDSSYIDRRSLRSKNGEKLIQISFEKQRK